MPNDRVNKPAEKKFKIEPVSEPSLNFMPCSETPKHALELGLTVGSPPRSHSRSAPRLTSTEVTLREPSPSRPTKPVSKADRAKILVMRALVHEFDEWMSTLDVDPEEKTLSDELRDELYYRFKQVGKLCVPLTEFAESQELGVNSDDYNRVYDSFYNPFKAATDRANAILRNPADVLPVQGQPSTSSFGTPPDLQPPQTESPVDMSAFEEFRNAMEEPEEALDRVHDLYDQHVLMLFKLGDLNYVRATKALRDRFVRYLAERCA